MTALVPGEGKLLLVMIDVNYDFDGKSAFYHEVGSRCASKISWACPKSSRWTTPLRNYARGVHSGSGIKNILQFVRETIVF